MQKLILLLAGVLLLACSDGKSTGPAKSDAGDDKTPDATTLPEDDAGETEDAGGSNSQLERAPGSLPKPPAGGLPADMKPPR
jgi:hypothetical protein